MKDQATLALLQDGLRHIKGLVGVLDRWIELQKERTSHSPADATKREEAGPLT